jgi:hypothetical protein
MDPTMPRLMYYDSIRGPTSTLNREAETNRFGGLSHSKPKTFIIQEHVKEVFLITAQEYDRI